jgi:mevalonate pyrophosphate decarboxylase
MMRMKGFIRVTVWNRFRKEEQYEYICTDHIMRVRTLIEKKPEDFGETLVIVGNKRIVVKEDMFDVMKAIELARETTATFETEQDDYDRAHTRMLMSR